MSERKVTNHVIEILSSLHVCACSREKFFSIVKDVCQSNYKQSMDKVLGHLTMTGNLKDDNIRSLFFGDYMAPEGEKIYDEVMDFKELTHTMEQWVVM